MATKIVNGQEVELTQAEEDAIIAEWLANKAQQDLEATPEFKLQQDRERERRNFDSIYKRFALTAMDEINLLRSWITGFKTQVAAATTLADLKTRVAALPNVPQRTADQLKSAMDLKD